jgi:hypothetical protein
MRATVIKYKMSIGQSRRESMHITLMDIGEEEG